MATNRDKIANEQLATFIFDGIYKHCDYCILQGNCYSGRCESRGTCINNIVSWLEKEAEEDLSRPPKIKLDAHFKEVEITVKEWNEIKEHIEESLKEETKDLIKSMRPIPMTLEEAEELADKLRKMQKSWGMINNKEKNKIADQMFEELGYKRIEANHGYYIAYERKEEIGGMTTSERIIIDTSHNLYRYAKQDRQELSCAITEAEDKAIHKKIEELKNGTN